MRLIIAGLLAAAAGCASTPAARPDTGRVLIFSGSTGYRHASIEAGAAAVAALARRDGFQVTATEDPAVFSTAGLRGYAVVVLLSTTTRKDDPASEWFAGERRTAFQSFVRGGGGVVAVHAAADSHYGWPWYGRLIGGRFASHPPGTPAGELAATGHRHPGTRTLPARFRRTDEWYAFGDYDPTSDLLVTLDPASIGAADVNPDPISWAREFEGGRVFYTAMGHTAESFSEPLFLQHLSGGLRWAARR